MQSKQLNNPLKYITSLDVGVFFLALLFFGLILFNNVPTDIQLHVATVRMAKEGEIPVPANFLYYLTIYAIALFNTDSEALKVASALVLACSVVAKLIITRLFFIQTYRDALNNKTIPIGLASLFSLLLLSIFSLPTSSKYVGQIPSNVWHNSTIIFLMPFAVSTFWLSYKQLTEPKTNRILPITILCILGILVKPSFFLVFSVAYPLMLIARFGFKGQTWKNMVPVLAGSVFLVAIYYLIYALAPIENGEKSSIVLKPFYIWSRYSSNIPLSLLASLAFPLTYFLLYPKDLIKHLLLKYAVISYSIALLIFILFSETGTRALHGNFGWQGIVFSYILFLCTSISFAVKINKFTLSSWRNKVIALAFLAHVIAGVSYIVHVLVNRQIF